MKRRDFVKAVPAFAILAGSISGLAEETNSQQRLQPIILPPPAKEGGKSILAAWFHNCDKDNTVREFNLKPSQKVLFAQTVGYPA